MNQRDAEAIVAIATLAALADGVRDAAEHSDLAAAATRLGLPDAETAVQSAAAGKLDLPSLAAQLSDPEAQRDAYNTAVAVCHADGALSTPEKAFLSRLSLLLSIDEPTAALPIETANTISASVVNAPVSTSASATAGAPDLDAHILDQAILTAALELLPDGLANMAILPLQLRLVRHIGQKHGQEMNASQIKDLAATFGIGAAAQLMESVVRRTFGGLAGGLLGGLFGGAAGMAAGGAVTFASTYALGHAAEQYYRQGRSISTADMKALFTRFQADANTLYPRVQERVTGLARGNTLDGLLRSVRG